MKTRTQCNIQREMGKFRNFFARKGWPRGLLFRGNQATLQLTLQREMVLQSPSLDKRVFAIGFGRELLTFYFVILLLFFFFWRRNARSSYMYVYLKKWVCVLEMIFFSVLPVSGELSMQGLRDREVLESFALQRNSHCAEWCRYDNHCSTSLIHWYQAVLVFPRFVLIINLIL